MLFLVSPFTDKTDAASLGVSRPKRPLHTKNRRVDFERFSLKFYRLPLNGKTSKKSMQNRRDGLDTPNDAASFFCR